MSWAIAIGIAVVCAGLEAWLSGPKPFDALALGQHVKDIIIKAAGGKTTP